MRWAGRLAAVVVLAIVTGCSGDDAATTSTTATETRGRAVTLTVDGEPVALDDVCRVGRDILLTSDDRALLVVLYKDDGPALGVSVDRAEMERTAEVRVTETDDGARYAGTVTTTGRDVQVVIEVPDGATTAMATCPEPS